MYTTASADIHTKELPYVILLDFDSVVFGLLFQAEACILKFLFQLCLLLYVPVNSYCHFGTVSYLTTLFSCASLNKRLASTSCTFAFRLIDPAEGRRLRKEWDRARIGLATVTLDLQSDTHL